MIKTIFERCAVCRNVNPPPANQTSHLGKFAKRQNEWVVTVVTKAKLINNMRFAICMMDVSRSGRYVSIKKGRGIADADANKVLGKWVRISVKRQEAC